MGLNKIFSYLNHYGIRSLLFSFYEKKILDKKRFEGMTGEPSSFDNSVLLPNEGSDPASHSPDLERKRILYLTHHFYPDRRGGTERFVYNMAKRAQELGNIPTVLVLDFNLPMRAYTDSVGEILYRRFEYMGIPCIGFRHKKAPVGLYYKRVDSYDPEMRRFADFIFDEERIDVIHSAYPQSFAPLLSEARERSIPYIVTLTDFALVCHYANMVKSDGSFCRGSEFGCACSRDCRCALVKDFEKRYSEARALLMSASGVFVPSEFSQRVYMSEFPGLSVSVIPHGINESFSFVRRQGVPKRILYVGGKTKHKGLELLLSAFAEIDSPDVGLTVLGAERTGRISDDRISFISFALPEQMPKLYQSADIVVVPSLFYESYNFAAREAIACGALVVCSDIGAIGEAVSDGENGFLFKAGSKDALVGALKRALDFELSSLKEWLMPTVAEEFEAYRRSF